MKTTEQEGGVSKVSGEIEEGPDEVWLDAIVEDGNSKLLDANLFVEMLCRERTLANSSIVIFFSSYWASNIYSSVNQL